MVYFEGLKNKRSTPVKAPETFSAEYVQKLLDENKAYQQRVQESEQRLREATEAITKATETKTDMETAVPALEAEITAKTEERIQRAELKTAEILRERGELKKQAELEALAVAAGIKNMEYLKLADITAVTLDDNGDVVGADKIIEKMKTEMPDLFLIRDCTSSLVRISGAPAIERPKRAPEMTPEEYEAAKVNIITKGSPGGI